MGRWPKGTSQWRRPFRVRSRSQNVYPGRLRLCGGATPQNCFRYHRIQDQATFSQRRLRRRDSDRNRFNLQGDSRRVQGIGKDRCGEASWRRSQLLVLRYFSRRTDRDFQSATATWRLRLLIGPRRPYLFPRRRRWRRLVIWRWRWLQRGWREFWWRRRRIELVTDANERISQQAGS